MVFFWKVISNGKDTGIIESNFKAADKFWKGVAIKLKRKIVLQKVYFENGIWIKERGN